MANASLAENFDRYFRVVCADREALRNSVYHVRWEVYCKEFGYERRREDGLELEFDEYDPQAAQCLIVHRATGFPAGCVRLVPSGPVDRPLPLMAHCADSLMLEACGPSQLPADASCEISRLVVHTRFRRRTGEAESPLGDVDGLEVSASERRTFPLLSVVLFLAATSLVVESGRVHVFAMMELRLARLLKRSGLVFRQVGNVTEFHGLRAAHYIRIDEAIKGLNSENRELFEELAGHLQGCRAS